MTWKRKPATERQDRILFAKKFFTSFLADGGATITYIDDQDRIAVELAPEIPDPPLPDNLGVNL